MKRKVFTVLKTLTAVFVVALLAVTVASCGEKPHEYGDGVVTKPATCTESGVMTYTCEIHGDKYTEVIPPLGHTLKSSTIVEPTCSMYGYTVFTCNLCGETSVGDITPALDHDYAAEVVSPTCAEQGYTLYSCTRCADSYKTDFTESVGHTYTASVVEPTCSMYGYTVFTCSACGETSVGDIVPALDHDYAAEIVSPTCTEQGYTLHTCTRCGISYADSPTSPLGHSYTEETVTVATQTASGTKKYTCARCGDTYTEKYTAEKMTPEEIYSIAEKSVGKVTAYNEDGKAVWIGTCFAIDENGTFVTNYHVAADAAALKITINGKTYDVTHVLAADREKDLAVIKVAESGFTPLVLNKGEVSGGSAVYAVGHSEGYDMSFSTGSVACPGRVVDGVHNVQHDAAISSGNSGGPLFDEYGCVIGVNTWTNKEGQNLNFAVSITELDALDYSKPLTLSQFYESYESYYSIWIGEVKVSEREANDSIANAQLVSRNGTTIMGTVNGASDLDVYRINVRAGEKLTVVLYPEYSLDAEGILCVIADKDGNTLDVGELSSLSGTSVQYLEYRNNGSSPVTLFVALKYYSSYKFKDDVANYALFFYTK